MASIAHGLMIKYGLRGYPEQAEIDRWIVEVNRLIGAGTAPEEAGSKAAAAIFPSFNTCVYASEADTITSLLGRAKE